jgi:hypothetical protein
MKKHKASILAVTMITLSIILVMALSVSLVAIKQRNASLGSGKSNTAFQNADTGIETVMNDIIKHSAYTVNQLTEGGTCTGERIVNSSSGYTVELKKEDGTAINCSDTTIKASEIASIKSVGTGASQESRAIEAAVAGTSVATQVINNATGPSPASTSWTITSDEFATSGGTLVILASGSAFSSTPPSQIGMDISIDDVTKGTAKVTAIGDNQYSFVSQALVVPGITAGTHTIKLKQATSTTKAGSGSFFNVTVLELK